MRTTNGINPTRSRYTRLEAMQMRYEAKQRQARNVCLKAATLETLSELTDYVNNFDPEGIYPPEDTTDVYGALQTFLDGLMELNAGIRDQIRG